VAAYNDFGGLGFEEESNKMAACIGEGKSAVEKQKKSKAVEEIKQLSEQILSETK
jgi:hypothetical protein